MTARRPFVALLTALCAAGLAACQAADRDPEADAAAGAAAQAGAVEVIARDYAFVGPAEIPSGWTTFRLKNEGMEHHFLLLSLLPEGKTFDDYVAEVAQPFDSVWHGLRSGAMDKAEGGALLGRLLPEWFASVKQMGGPGLVAPGRAAQTSVNLPPGDYVMECYVKTAEGEFHAVLGMARPLTVTSDMSAATEPQAGIDITLSNYEMAIQGDATPGTHTVAVRFEEHPEVGLGNDVHVVRLDEGMDMGRLVSWMDWMNIDGLREPAPAEFVGGAQEMPVGYTTYFTLDLEPGRYAWIAESAADKGMIQEFTVPPPRTAPGTP